MTSTATAPRVCTTRCSCRTGRRGRRRACWWNGSTRCPRASWSGATRRRNEPLLNTGITFTVYGDDQGTERIFPFDIVPRIVPGATWEPFERGLKERIEALNLFLDDIYHDQRIVRDGVVSRFVIESSQGFRPQCVGLDPPGGVWCRITGTDLVRLAQQMGVELVEGATWWWPTTGSRCARRGG